MKRELDIYYGDRKVGIFGVTEQAEYYIAYSEEWLQSGFPVSVHLPLTQEMYKGKVVEYFIENLLPEAGIRLAIAQQHGISEDNYFSLMQRIGHDCAGAFSLGAAQSTGEYKELTRGELKEILIHLPQYPLVSHRKGVSFSLAGAQHKIPLYLKGEKFYLPLNGAASNIIVKTPISRVENSVANELFCMRLGKRVLRHIADVEYLSLDEVSSLVVHRYDRTSTAKSLQRTPQEDFCQLTGLPSAMKYESDGGPGFRRCAELIRQYSVLPAPDINRLVRWAVFNLCIGNMDAHAKNLSLYTIKGNLKLAPFYDLISTLQYPAFNGDLAMCIGARRNPARIGKKQWEAFAEELLLPKPFVLNKVREVIQNIINYLPDVAAELSPLPVDQSFISDLKQNILHRCMNLRCLLA